LCARTVASKHGYVTAQSVHRAISSIDGNITTIDTIGGERVPGRNLNRPGFWSFFRAIAGAAVSSLLTKSPQAPVQSTPQSRFDTAAEQAVAVQASAAAEKSNQTVYLIAGGAALLALFYFMSKRK
jgi:hypothetical protein